jgi:hypothetical protein
LEDDSNTSARGSLLELLGIPPIDAASHPGAFTEIRRISRHLSQTGGRAIGFVPADDQVGAIALAVQIAVASSQLYERTCNVLDANLLRPQFAHSPHLSNVPVDSLGLRTVWIAERVTLSTPATPASLLVFSDIARATERSKSRYDHVFVDLTGFALWGEHHSAYDLVDGVAVVAVANQTLERDILVCSDDIPSERRLGVVLIG